MRRRNDPTNPQPSLPVDPQPTPAPGVVDRSTTQAATPPAAPEPPKAPKFQTTPYGEFVPPRMPGPYERIVTTVFDMPDPHEEFQRLRNELQLTDVRASSASYGQVVDALDQAEKNAQRAVELKVNFEATQKAFEMDALAISGPLRERAKEALEQEKRDEFQKMKDLLGSKAPTGKQITEADVAACMASMFPDEARILAQREAEAKGSLEATKSLADRWAERARDLRMMVGTVRNTSH